MVPLGVFLAVFSAVLLILTLALVTRPVRVPSPSRGVLRCRKPEDISSHKTIVVKIPREGSIPGDYTLDLRLSLSRAGKEESGEKESRAGQRNGLYYRRLDEYL